MKYVILLLFFFSCSSHKPDVKPNGFLTKEEVYKLFKNQKFDNEIQMTPEVIERVQNLIDDNQFYDEEMRAKPEDEMNGEFEGIQVADEIDLREYANPDIVNQINGRCTAYSMMGTLELLSCKNYGYCNHNLSESHSWSYDSNYSCKTKVESHRRNYVALEKYWLHDEKYPKIYDVNKKGAVKIEHGWYLGANEQKVIDSLNLGLPVFLGMKTPSSMLSCKPNVNYSNPSSGGHALSIVGYYHYPEDKDLEYVVILRNSWGKKCGDHGYQYMPLSMCHQKGYYCMFWTFDKLSIIKDNMI